MQINWSVVLNVLLLLGVLGAIMRTLSQRREPVQVRLTPSMGGSAVELSDIHESLGGMNINVNPQSNVLDAAMKATLPPLTHRVIQIAATTSSAIDGATVMMFLSAKDNRKLAGYELWQTVLAAGFRFGEGQLFHRHQLSNGQGPVMCSLAAATPEGVFDLQNIGAFVVRGLCLFMYASGNPTIDAERFEMMLDTARHLSEGLDTNLLDSRRQPLSDASIEQYHKQLHLDVLLLDAVMED